MVLCLPGRRPGSWLVVNFELISNASFKNCLHDWVRGQNDSIVLRTWSMETFATEDNGCGTGCSPARTGAWTELAHSPSGCLLHS